MKYQVILYNKGNQTLKHIEVNGKTHLDALKSIKTMKTWTHALVRGKTNKRYTKNLKIIKDAPRFFKTSNSGSWIIMVMLGKLVEFHKYNDQSERDRIFEEISCMESTPVASVTTDKEPKDITASIEEMSDSKSGSTDPKISNGSAKHATWTDALILTSTEKSSGKSKSKDTDLDTWLYGSKASPSKQNTKTLWATVKRLPRDEESVHGWPGINVIMYEMEGKKIQVTWSKTQDCYHGTEGWTWKPEWLDFAEEMPENLLTAVVKNIEDGTLGSYGGQFVYDMKRYIGKTIHVEEKLFHGHPYFTSPDTRGYWFAPEWLEFGGSSQTKNQSDELVETIKKIKEMDKEMKKGKFKFIGGAFPVKPIGYIDPSAV